MDTTHAELSSWLQAVHFGARHLAFMCHQAPSRAPYEHVAERLPYLASDKLGTSRSAWQYLGHAAKACACPGVYKLASLVQYVPLPVVAGYLGYVGYFCLAAGLSLACNVQVGASAAACNPPPLCCLSGGVSQAANCAWS